MLEDRKFYYPITDDFKPWGTKTDEYWKAGEFPVLIASPWQVVGPSGTVKMNTTKPFVGDHDPVIQVKENAISGIRQGGMAIVEGRTYIGRVVLSAKNIKKIDVRISDEDGDMAGSHNISEIENPDDSFQTYSFEFIARKSSASASLEIVGSGEGSFTIGTISLMPEDNIQGFRADVIELLRELNSPIYRWPGGNFVSGYDWKDGIGDRDKRPPRKNPAWTGVEHNDVGIHEFMDFCMLVDTEPFIAVNTGLGTVEEVAEELEYCNGSEDTPMGKWRAENGHAASYEVKYWAVGNEMYGDWQLGHMPLSEYVKKHNAMAEAMWAIDPDVQLIAVGSVGEWSETMMRECSNHMNLISEHIYEQEKENVIEHSKMIPAAIRAKAEAHRQYREDIPGLAEKDIRIAMDEWNHWYGDYIYGELGVRYYHKDGLGIARGLHEYFRNSDLYFMANYAQTVNVIGAIKTTKTAAEFATTGLVLKLYREHFGVHPIQCEWSNDTLDISAAWSDDQQILTLAVVNPSEKEFHLNLENVEEDFNEIGTAYLIATKDPLAYNEPGKPRSVNIEERNFTTDELSIDPLSITLFKLIKVKS
jgi:alpha-N-arabinofuranosidase